VKLPNAERAIVDPTKLRAYCLNPDHPRGRHKARVFAAALGLTATDTDYLQAVFLAAVRTNDALLGEQDIYGQRWSVDIWVRGPAGEAMVRTTWIVRSDEDVPRLTSCYVL
jgi:hypothetical protein